MSARLLRLQTTDEAQAGFGAEQLKVLLNAFFKASSPSIFPPSDLEKSFIEITDDGGLGCGSCQGDRKTSKRLKQVKALPVEHDGTTSAAFKRSKKRDSLQIMRGSAALE